LQTRSRNALGRFVAGRIHSFRALSSDLDPGIDPRAVQRSTQPAKNWGVPRWPTATASTSRTTGAGAGNRGAAAVAFRCRAWNLAHGGVRNSGGWRSWRRPAAALSVATPNHRYRRRPGRATMRAPSLRFPPARFVPNLGRLTGLAVGPPPSLKGSQNLWRRSTRARTAGDGGRACCCPLQPNHRDHE
jgi:hypothetical protein